jgi:hypothetical protein
LGRAVSIDGYKSAYVITHKSGFAVAYPQVSKSSAELAESLRRFTMEWGIPRKLTVDGALEQVKKGTEFQKRIRSYDINLHVSASRSPKENPAEGVQRTTSSSRYANGRTPIEIITGETPDLSEYLDFGFYDWVFFKENIGMGVVALGRFLGVSHRVGNLMSYWILPVTGHIVSRTSVLRVTNLELQEENLIRRCRAFDIAIKNYCNNEQYIIQPDMNIPNFDLQLDLDDDPDYQEEFNRVLENKAIEEDDDYTPDAHDQYLDMEITLPRGTDGTAEYAKVIKRAKDIDGKPMGKAHDNPVMDTRQYEVEWHDGKREIIFANTIAENLYSQVDQEGNRHVIFNDIIAHRSADEAVKDEDSFFVSWKDGSTNWLPLKDVKDSYPVQLAVYAVSRGLQEQPVFAWWVAHALKKRDKIISKVKTKYWLRTHKYGIELPKSVEHAKQLDLKNGNPLWWDAIMQDRFTTGISTDYVSYDIRCQTW